MSGASSAKKLLSRFNQLQYRTFLLNTDAELILPEVSSAPGVGASKRKDVYKKKISHPQSNQHVKFITKNNESHTFLWQTKPEQLKEGVRWGIIRTQSITGRVISTLGNYRVSACKRIAKGLISNTQIIKIKLLDLFQDRFEALQDLESLVNRNTNTQNYETKLNEYIQKLEQIRIHLDAYFTDIPVLSGFAPGSITEIENDLQKDIERAKSYLQSLKTVDSLRSYNRARGNDSIVEFVKQQMLHGLYEFQGINQDITYSSQRSFALTRGELNDFIEDARKEIDDYQTDIRNTVTQKHHGLFATEDKSLITYDFSDDHLSPEREREVLLAISFIEEWDKLDTKTLTVFNETGSEELEVIRATKWVNHKSLSTAVQSLLFYVFNMFKSTLFPTKPWEEEAWKNPDFHLVATELRKHSSPHEPMWQKPVNLFKKLFYALIDVFNGVQNFGSQLVIEMPHNLRNDWDACEDLTPLSELLKEVENDFDLIKKEEQLRLNESLQLCGYNDFKQTLSPETSKLAAVEYDLFSGEQNDILTAMVRGLTEFSTVFSHNLFAKDPVAGLVFTSAFAVGASAILMPATTASIFGTTYVNWFTSFSYSMSSSKLAAALTGGSSQAQLFATGWDGLINGPSGIAMNSLYHLGEDPLTAAAYLAAATGVGYVLVNGIAGHPIPWLSAFLKEDLGTSPELSYPFIGAKTAILLYKVLKHKNQMEDYPKLSPELVEMAHTLQAMEPEQQLKIDRFILASWLSINADVLPKLESRTLFELSRHIEALFPKEQSESLKKILYPKIQRSIGFQLFSIPLTYIPAVLRFLLSPVLSIFALINGKSHPFEPMKREAANLIDKSKKDLSRLMVFTTYVVSLLYTGISTPIKAIAYIATMMIGRIGGFFDVKPAHAIHSIFASCHIFFRNLGEYFYPARAIKSVAVAHPAHTLKEVEDSYVAVLKQMGAPKAVTKAEPSNPISNKTALSFDRKTKSHEEPTPQWDKAIKLA